jgi:predicted nucleic acid-binding protein
LVAASVVLSYDDAAADRAAQAWAALSRRARHALGDILIAGIAVANALPVVTRNQRDFAPIAEALPELKLIDWSR